MRPQPSPPSARPALIAFVLLVAIPPVSVRGQWDDTLDTTGVMLVRQGQRLESMGRLDEARILYQRGLALEPGSAEAMSRLARLNLYLKDYDAAYELLRRVRRDHPADALGLAVTGLYQFCLRQSRRALQSVDQSLQADPALREAYLIKADILFAVRDMKGARTTLDRLLEIHPKDPEGLYLKGIVRFYDRDLVGAQALLETSHRMNPEAFNVRKDLVQIYNLNGQPERALAILESLLESRPDDASLATLKVSLAERIRLKTAGAVRRQGPFRIQYTQGTDPATLDRILAILRDAYETIGRNRSSRPRTVQVTVLNQTDQLLPAYYNHVSDEITISREYFERLDTESKRELGRHLIFHEYSHLAFYHDLGVPLPPAALWVIEGLAEYEAGGYTYTPVDFEETFAEGLFDLESLEEYLPVSAVGTGTHREVAYIQSYAMVGWILQTRGTRRGMDLIKEIALAYTRRGPDHEAVLKVTLSLTPDQFLDRVGTYIHRRWIARDDGGASRLAMP